jgi:DNA-binding CsgD family transcriptional regulator/PAS domain-containing protein
VTELTPKSEASGRNDLDTASVGLLTIDTVSRAITSCNDAFAEVVGRPADDLQGCLITDFIDDEAKSVATAVIDGIRAGYISSVDGNVDLFRQAGSVGVDCWILALGTDLPRHVAMAGVIPGDGTVPAEAPSTELGFRPIHLDLNRVVLATLDDEWRIIEMAPGSASQLGWPEPRPATVMPQLHELVHPADSSVLDESFGRRSSMETPDTFLLRLRGPEEQWLSSRVTVSPLRGSVPARFGLVISLRRTEEPGETESERLARLEDQLARIRQVVQSTEGAGATGSVDLSDLTMRQREIVDRLLRGHRVDAIARDLYVSPSTVRNHLSAIFDKLGVASQSELVELLRGDAGGTGSKTDPDVL